MSNPVDRIKQARQLLELGEITEEVFESIKASVLAEMGIVAESLPESVNPPSSAVGHTQVDGRSSVEPAVGPAAKPLRRQGGSRGAQEAHGRGLRLLRPSRGQQGCRVRLAT